MISKYYYNPLFGLAACFLFLLFPILLMLFPDENQTNLFGKLVIPMGECCMIIVILMYAYTTCNVRIFTTEIKDNQTIDEKNILTSMYCNYLVLIGRMFIYVVLFYFIFRIMIHFIVAHGNIGPQMGWHQGIGFTEKLFGEPVITPAQWLLIFVKLVLIFKFFVLFMNLCRIIAQSTGQLFANIYTKRKIAETDEIKNKEEKWKEEKDKDGKKIHTSWEIRSMKNKAIEEQFIDQEEKDTSQYSKSYNEWLTEIQKRLEDMNVFALFDIADRKKWPIHLISIGMGGISVLIYYISLKYGKEKDAPMDDDRIKTIISNANKIAFSIVIGCYVFCIIRSIMTKTAT